MAAWGRIGFGAWALAQVAFAIAAVQLDFSLLSVVGFGVGAAGSLIAALSSLEDRPARWTTGVALTLLGVLPFFAEVYLPPSGLDGYAVASISYLLGLATLVMAGILASRDALGHATWVRVGAGLAALAGVIWLPLDGVGSRWFAGNALEFVGALLVALRPRD